MAHSASSSKYSNSDDSQQAEMHPFSAADNDHHYLRKSCGMLCDAFNAQPSTVSKEERTKAWNNLASHGHQASINLIKSIGTIDGAPPPEAPLVKSPFYVDYGTNVHIAPSAFVHRYCYLQDTPFKPIVIGEGTLIGPNVHVISVKHDVDWRHRHGSHGPAWAMSVVIGDDCYIGSCAVIMPGVTIGDGCVIGASSVVTKSIPAYHVAAGNPARPIHKVALDVPDAPGLLYERRGSRMVVIPEPPSQQQSEVAGQAVFADHANTNNATMAVEQIAPADTLATEREKATDHAHHASRAERELMRVLNSMEPKSPRLIGIDVFLLVAAVMIAWLIFHTILY